MDNVTKEQFLIDYNNTEKELEAYYNILTGFRVLSNLPENETGKYKYELMEYESYFSRCSDFLAMLKELGIKKGWL